MTKQFWSKYFSSKILARGREYFRTDAVGDLSFDPQSHVLTAEVYGTEIYDVSIQLNTHDNDIEDMDCTCPYALDRENCKHMAAVLFALDAHGFPESADTDDSTRITLEEAVQLLSEEEAKAYVLECAQKDTKLREKLLLRSSETITPQQKSLWKKQIQKIVCDADYDDYDEYRYYEDWEYDSIYFFTMDLVAFMDEVVPELIRKKFYSDAFEFVCDVYDEAHDAECYEENGYFSDLDQCFMRYWNEIVPNADGAAKREMYSWLSKTAIRDGLLDYLVDLFPEKEFLERDLKIIDAQIQKHVEDEDVLEFLIALRCEVMFRMETSDEEIRLFREQYRYLYGVRRQEAQQAISSGNPEEAIRIATEGKTTDKEWYQKEAWVKMLIDLYAQTRQAEQCRAELLHYTLRYTQKDLQYVTRLKEMTPAVEWASVRDQLLQSESMEWRKCEFLHSEQMVRQLFKIAAAKGTTDLLLQYEDDFKTNFPEETRDAILQTLDKEMQNARSRNHYASIAQRLCRVRSYPDGEAYANDTAMRWAQQYFRRSAMKDELRSAGFLIKVK